MPGNYPRKSIISIMVILPVSIVLGSLLGLLIYVLLARVLDNEFDNYSYPAIVFTTIIAILSSIVFLLLGIIFNRVKKEHAHLRELVRLKHTASTDTLTKLYNRRFLETYLENQLEAARLTDRPLSIIMLDIDYFKNINDTYGHMMGDHVLTFFSTLILKCIRQSELAVRYGGEEFIVVLPSTTMEIATIIAERIRQTVETSSIPPLDNIIIPPVTCSLGVSSFPIHCNNRKDLIRTADIALYSAKHAGRNCTRVYRKGQEIGMKSLHT